MKKYYRISLSIIIPVIITMVFVGCAKDLTNTVYNGPDLIEFGNPISKTVTTTTTPKKDSALVQLVGPQRSTPINVSFTVNSASTAVATTDYTLLTTSPVVIPANSSSAWIYFTLNKVSTTKTLIIDLTSGDNVTLSPNYKTFTFTLK